MSASKKSKLGSYSRLYSVWAGILTRCYNPNSPNYRNYGARGIKVCEEWKTYENFEKWALNNGYNPNHEKKTISIERTDTNGDYSPDNCVWATAKEQMNNTRRNTFVTFNGKTKTLAEWAEHYGINYSTFMSRYSRGWDMARIASTPTHKYERRTSQCRS